MSDIVERKNNEVMDNQAGIPLGMENANLETVTMPTAKLLQASSPEVTEEEFEDYGFRAGKIIHSLLLEELPEKFIPIMVADDNTCFVPRNDADKQALKVKVKDKFGVELTEDELQNNMFICRARDGRNGDRFGKCSQCRLNKFDNVTGEKPFCTSNINVLALFEGQEMPVVIRFANTSYKHGNKFKSLVLYSGGAVFSRKYKLVPIKKSSNGNTWYEMTVKPAGKPTDEELGKAKALYKRYADAHIEVENDGIEPANEAEF